MPRMKIKLYLPLVALCLLFGCKKDRVIKQPFITGKYVGTFNYVIGDKTIISTGPAQITFGPTTYNSIGQTDKKPAGGSGTYTFNPDAITFTDKQVWTADFNWSFILKDEYAYQAKGDSLILKRQLPIQIPGINSFQTICIYKLKRVNDAE